MMTLDRIVENDRFQVVAMNRDGRRQGPSRVMAFGPTDVPQPTRAYEAGSPLSVAVWARYRRDVNIAYRDAAREALWELLGLEPGKLTYYRSSATGLAWFTASNHDLEHHYYVLIKGS